ncbi:MAG: hypothetical protein KDJ19_10860 [Hyphomicrobiaceae bacterium]|nr:hypothetical protein [Hyphomicrobiaceae bacterium]MCC0025037.1 hypothetical protein [Hyphomicrobiaceae bacterium]
MIVLEKLYDCAEQYLKPAPADWDRFAKDFKSIFHCDLVLYHLAPHANGVADDNGPDSSWIERVSVVATSNAEVIGKYLASDVYQSHEIPEHTLASLEPVRRSDLIPDEAFRELTGLYEHHVALGMYYDAMVPAVLADNSSVHLYLWRD